MILFYIIFIFGVIFSVPLIISHLKGEPDTTVTVSYLDETSCTINVAGEDYHRVKYALSELITLGRRRQYEIVIPISSLHEFGKTLKDYKVNVVLDTKVAELLDNWDSIVSGLEEAKVTPYDIETQLDLMSYQKQGVNFLRYALLNARPYARGALLGDPVGLGKTAQAIGAGHSLISDGTVSKVIVICPSGLRYNWEREIGRFTGELSIVSGGTFESREESYGQWCGRKHARWLICGYDSMKRESDLELLKSKADSQTLVILDEAQYVKNWAAQRSRAVRNLAKRTFGCILMSATFIENNLSELYNVTNLISGHVFGNVKAKFLERYTDRDIYGNVTGHKRLEEVREKLAPFLVRRRKTDVGDEIASKIPERVIHTDYWVELTPAQRKTYGKLIDETVELDTGKELNVTNALTRLSIRRQLCLFPQLIGDNGTSTKGKALIEIINSFEPEAKILIFTFYHGAAKMIGEILDANKISNVTVVGDDREAAPELVKKFESDPSIRVMVANDFMKAGHNLQMAEHLIHFDQLWNPQSMRQREGRIDRIGQKAKVITVTTIITKGTVEELMFEIINKKRELFDEVIEAGLDEPRLTRNQVEKILERERTLFGRRRNAAS